MRPFRHTLLAVPLKMRTARSAAGKKHQDNPTPPQVSYLQRTTERRRRMFKKVVYCGLDAGSRTFHLVAMSAAGAILVDRKFDMSEANLITAFKGLNGEAHVHLEATDLAGWIRGVLLQRVSRVKKVYVSHPKTNAWIAKDPNKNDRVDAFKLAELLRMKRVHEVYYPDSEDRMEFKRVVQHYDDLTDQQKCLKQKIKARLRAHGVIVRGKGVYSEAGRQKALSEISSGVARESIGQLYRVLDDTVEAQQDAFKLMRRESHRYPEIEIFREVPGIELRLACRFSAYIQTPHRFSSKSKLWRYCRLGVTDRKSDGKPLGRRKLDRNGHGRLKDLSRKAFQASLRRRDNNAFKRAYRRCLQRTHNTTHARLTTQRKILTTLWTIWKKKGGRYRDDLG
jgi:transposase